MAVFWVVAPCSLVEVYQLIALMMEAARFSETLVNFYQIARRYNPEDSHFRTHRRENLKSIYYLVYMNPFSFFNFPSVSKANILVFFKLHFK
jgi:hypothetical protein